MLRIREPKQREILDEAGIAYVTNRWSRRVVQPLLISLQVTALFTAVFVIIAIVTSNEQWMRMPLFCFLVTLEGVYTTLWLSQPNQRIIDKLSYRGAEIIVILLLTRLFTWSIGSNIPVLSQYQEFLREPQQLFADGLFIVGALLLIMAWLRAIDLTQLFKLLAIDRAEAAYYLTPQRERREDQRPFLHNRLALVDHFVRQWLWGGVALTLFTAATTLNLPELATLRNPFAISRLGIQPQVLTAILIYFITGFALLSQARLAAQNARWLREGVQKSARVERQWHRISLRLLLAIGLLAAFLPLGSTTGIGRLLDILVFAMTNLLTLLVTLFFSLLALLLPQSQEGNTESFMITPEPLPTPFPTPDLPPASPPSETVGLVFSSAFWAVAIVLSVVAVSFFLRERGVRVNTTQARRLWTAVTVWLRTLWQGARQQATTLRRAVQDRLQIAPKLPGTPEAKRPFRFIRVNGLPPREQIRYFYLSLVRRAEETGVEREQSETPLEFAQDLKEQYPDAEIDVSELTDAFLKARYSPQPIDKEDVNPVKRRWKKMRSRLRRGRKQ